MSIKPVKSDSGAGVILIEKLSNDYVIILFRNNFTGKFSDGGGTRDLGEAIKSTAIRELREESLNTFIIDPKILSDSQAVRHNTYVTYFVYVKGPKGYIYERNYYHNYKVIYSRLTPRYWKETDAMTKVSISNLIKTGIMTHQGEFPTRDIYGNKIIIDGRTKASIRKAFELGLIQCSNKFCKINMLPIQLKEITSYIPVKSKFLQGTKCYVA